MAGDIRRSRAWRKLRDQVVQEEPDCRIRYAGVCTFTSTTADHIQPYSTHPHLGMVRSNLQGACEPCNRKKSNGTAPRRPDAELAVQSRALDIFTPLHLLPR